MTKKVEMPPHLVPKVLLERMQESWKASKAWHPRVYQEWGMKKLLEDPFSGLFLEPGMGKTSTALGAFTVLLKKRMVRRMLVVAPKRALYEVWPLEVSDWTDFHHLGVALLHGAKKDAVLRQLTPAHQICLVTFDGLDWLMNNGAARMKQLDADELVIDESSKVKNSNTVRFRALRKHLARFKRRHILTGSPRPRNYLDLFSQVYIMDRGEALGEYVTGYRQRYFYPTGFEMREWEILPGAAEQIDAKVAPMVLRLDADDYLKLPKVLERDHWVDLPEAARKEYDAVEEGLMSRLFTEPLTNSAAARSKCCQMANGSVYVDGPDEQGQWAKQRRWKTLHTAKVDALVDLYDELQGEPLLLGIGYKHDVESIRAALGKDLPCLNGDTTDTQARRYIDAWNAGDLPLFMVHPASAGHALNLQKCHPRHVGFFNIPDDYDEYDQTFKRARRQGNEAAFVVRHRFLARGTVDVAKVRNLQRKGQGQKAFLDAMRAYAEQKYGLKFGRG